MRYLSSISLALIVLMALACTATPVEKSQPIQSSAAEPTPEPKLAIEQARLVGPYDQLEFLISDDTWLRASQVEDKLGVDGLESRANPETGLVEVRQIDGDWLQVQPAYRSPLGEFLPSCASIAPDLTPDYFFSITPSFKPNQAWMRCSSGRYMTDDKWTDVNIILRYSASPTAADSNMRNLTVPDETSSSAFKYYPHPQWNDESVSWTTVETRGVIEGTQYNRYEIKESTERVLIVASIMFNNSTPTENIPSGIPDLREMERVLQIRDAVKQINRTLVDSRLESRLLRLNSATDRIEQRVSGSWSPLDSAPTRRQPYYSSSYIEAWIDDAWWPVQSFPLDENEWKPDYFDGLADLSPLIPGKVIISVLAYDELMGCLPGEACFRHR